jgi:hypothetical protein
MGMPRKNDLNPSPSDVKTEVDSVKNDLDQLCSAIRVSDNSSVSDVALTGC